MHGFSGAPAIQYLRLCEEVMEAANDIISSSAVNLPAIARPPIRHIPL